MEGDIDMCTKQCCITEFLSAENISSLETYRCLKNICRDNCVDISRVTLWVKNINDGAHGIKDLPRSGCLPTAMTVTTERRRDSGSLDSQRFMHYDMGIVSDCGNWL
jgi:hypothetical protein